MFLITSFIFAHFPNGFLYLDLIDWKILFYAMLKCWKAFSRSYTMDHGSKFSFACSPCYNLALCLFYDETTNTHKPELLFHFFLFSEEFPNLGRHWWKIIFFLLLFYTKLKYKNTVEERRSFTNNVFLVFKCSFVFPSAFWTFLGG